MLINIPSLDLNLSREWFRTLFDIKQSANDYERLQEIWAKNLHFFSEDFIPPLRVPDNFSLSNLKPEALNAVGKANIKLRKISDFLFARKVPETANYKTAIALFEDSVMQKFLSGE